MAWLTNRILGIPDDEALVSRRGFHVRDPDVQLRLELIGQTFLRGYHAALPDQGGAALARSLGAIDAELQGFAFEGAAMALTLLDHLMPVNRGRFHRFLQGPGAPHFYMLHVGAGWAMARLPWLRWRVNSFISTLDPLARWLALDGYGFHQGYFYWPDSLPPQKVSGGRCRIPPPRLRSRAGPQLVVCGGRGRVAHRGRHFQLSESPAAGSVERCRSGLRLCRRPGPGAP